MTFTSTKKGVIPMSKLKFEKIIRIITLAPTMALLTLSVLLAIRPDTFHGILNYGLSVAFLTLLPLSAYPLQPLIPHFKDKGREGQRQLAMIMAVIGYILGIIFALLLNMPKDLLLLYLTYLISGVLILFFNKVIKVRASGHACGVAGPIAFLIYFLGWPAIVGISVLVLVYWASLRMKRHTWSELLWGSVIPVAALLLSIIIVSLI